MIMKLLSYRFNLCFNNTGLKKLEYLNIGCCKCVTDSDMKSISGTDHKVIWFLS